MEEKDSYQENEEITENQVVGFDLKTRTEEKSVPQMYICRKKSEEQINRANREMLKISDDRRDQEFSTPSKIKEYQECEREDQECEREDQECEREDQECEREDQECEREDQECENQAEEERQGGEENGEQQDYEGLEVGQGDRGYWEYQADMQDLDDQEDIEIEFAPDGPLEGELFKELCTEMFKLLAYNLFILSMIANQDVTWKFPFKDEVDAKRYGLKLVTPLLLPRLAVLYRMCTIGVNLVVFVPIIYQKEAFSKYMLFNIIWNFSFLMHTIANILNILVTMYCLEVPIISIIPTAIAGVILSFLYAKSVVKSLVTYELLPEATRKKTKICTPGRDLLEVNN